MRVSFSKRTKWFLGTSLALLTFAVALWPSRPERILAMAVFHESKGPAGEVNGQRMRDQLIACGPSAIAPTIDAIRGGYWSRRYAYLPQVLGGLGEPAHQALLTAIDSEHDANARAYLICALQSAFSDFSRFDHWLADVSTGAVSSYQIVHFAGIVRWSFPESPDLEVDGKLNREFAEWWQTNKQHKTKPSHRDK